MDYKDITRLHQRVPELDVVAPVLFAPWGKTNTAYYKDQKTTPRIQGCTPEYAQVIAPKLYYGRYINEMDMKEHRKVCVIGKRIYKELFKDGGDPCGKSIRVDSTYYEVIGVDYAATNMNINGRAEQKITLPLSLMQETYNRGKEVDMVVATGREGVVMSKLTDRIREAVTMGHFVDPTDEQAAMVFKNIMMVTVRERTTEIGIRRAIGATPKMILSQIIAESIVLTLVAGMSGILFGVMILQMLEMGNTEDGIVTAHFQVGFWTAIFAALVVSAMGVLAGLAPAARAMSIKPVDAMRDE